MDQHLVEAIASADGEQVVLQELARGAFPAAIQ